MVRIMAILAGVGVAALALPFAYNGAGDLTFACQVKSEVTLAGDIRPVTNGGEIKVKAHVYYSRLIPSTAKVTLSGVTFDFNLGPVVQEASIIGTANWGAISARLLLQKSYQPRHRYNYDFILEKSVIGRPPTSVMGACSALINKSLIVS